MPKPQFEEKIVVPARDKVERRVACPAAGGELAWFFATVGNDCKFSVEFQPSAAGAATVEVRALAKCDSHHFPVTGVHTSSAPGEWIVTWGACLCLAFLAERAHCFDQLVYRNTRQRTFCFYYSISFDFFLRPPDNSYSWLTSKNVELTLRFTPPVSELEAGGNDEDDAKADLP